MTQVIEGQQAIEEHQYRQSGREVIFGVLADIFQLPHRVVGKVSDRAGGERRQARVRGGTMLPQQLLD